MRENPVKELRGNKEFWTIVLKNYALDMNLPYESPEEFYGVRESILKKKELDQGIFDKIE